jgi:hypothetical protein
MVLQICFIDAGIMESGDIGSSGLDGLPRIEWLLAIFVSKAPGLGYFENNFVYELKKLKHQRCRWIAANGIAACNYCFKKV